MKIFLLCFAGSFLGFAVGIYITLLIAFEIWKKNKRKKYNGSSKATFIRNK